MIEVTCSINRNSYEAELESYCCICGYLPCLGHHLPGYNLLPLKTYPSLNVGYAISFGGHRSIYFCLAKNEQHPDYTSFLKIMFRGILMLVEELYR